MRFLLSVIALFFSFVTKSQLRIEAITKEIQYKSGDSCIIRFEIVNERKKQKCFNLASFYYNFMVLDTNNIDLQPYEKRDYQIPSDVVCILSNEKKNVIINYFAIQNYRLEAEKSYLIRVGVMLKKQKIRKFTVKLIYKSN